MLYNMQSNCYKTFCKSNIEKTLAVFNYSKLEKRKRRHALLMRFALFCCLSTSADKKKK